MIQKTHFIVFLETDVCVILTPYLAVLNALMMALLIYNLHAINTG